VAPALRYRVNDFLDLLDRPANRSFSLIGAPGVKIDPVWNDNA